ncbi:MAG: VCBS repeat-containing protein [Acidobacteria bacterium]|nr:VCBS repeat-containing protein [Acidobacteriota bacterium]
MKQIGFNKDHLVIPGIQTTEHKRQTRFARNWLARLGLFSVFGGAFSLLVGPGRTVSANDMPNRGLPPRLPQKEKETRRLAITNSNQTELLRRQSEFRLPFVAKQSTASALPPPDDCPGTIVPAGTYTQASPYTATGDTAGANNSVTNFDGGYYYSYAGGPDHIYTFTLTAKGANPTIRVSTTASNPNFVIYALNGLRQARCPSGTNNLAYGFASSYSYPQSSATIEMADFPLNAPVHVFVDTFSPTATMPYTISIQDATMGQTVVPPSNDAPADLNADGKTDFPIVRNTGGGPGGQLTWFTRTSDSQFLSPATWGIEGDKPVTGDFDGDGQDDLAVWRPGPQGRFYIIRSRTQTIHVEDFGQTGDDPTVVGDHNFDGIDDVAVYRPGQSPGAQSYWYYRSLSSPPGEMSQVGWGQHGDRPVPGSFSPYGPVLIVHRADGPNGRFFIRYPWGYFDTVVFGLAGDMLVPGDYDGDGLTDLAVARPTDDGYLAWYFRPSSGNGTLVSRVWGVAATDTIVQADYNGDGRTDLAVWRPGSPGAFYIRDVQTGRVDLVPWGETGDVPVASFNKH